MALYKVIHVIVKIGLKRKHWKNSKKFRCAFRRG